ncbi:hypothetical protein BD779DRAFT_1468456 [Infundibulicybe gibba]|nr:hypothetical protein BD779DRAFT_1468456 [Infundibulicybe gibba]
MDTISEAAAKDFLAIVRLVKFCELSILRLILRRLELKQSVVLTFPREVDLIWTRYLGDFLMMIELMEGQRTTSAVFLNSNDIPYKYQGFIFIRVQGWACALQFFFMQTILVIRINAVCENSKYAQKVKRYLAIAFIIEILPLCALLFWGNVSWYGVTVEPLPGVHFCTAVNIPRWFPTWWIPVILFDVVLFTLALKFCLDEVKLMRALNTAGSHRKNLINVMLRDSILYYFVYVLFSLPIGISYEIMQGFSIAASSMMGCRIVLNLREAVYAPNGGSTIRQSHMDGLLQMQSAIVVPGTGDILDPARNA